MYLQIASGALLALSFAPIHFLPAILILSRLLHCIQSVATNKAAFRTGYLFGFGMFLASTYWISVGVFVYVEKFWWFLPISLLAPPAIMAILPACTCMIAFSFRQNRYFHFIFCVTWVFFEWLSCWICTGFPWCLLGYSLSFILAISQAASIFGVLGLSFLSIYAGSGFYSNTGLGNRVITMVFLTLLLLLYGISKIKTNPTEFTEHTIRLVQPSIDQTSKWDPEKMLQQIQKHIELSKTQFKLLKEFDSNEKVTIGINTIVPEMIIWPEGALTLPYYNKMIFERLMSLLSTPNQVLISGAITDNGKHDKLEIYNSIIALNGLGQLDFEYHKSHLVPFGEYVPFRTVLPMNKIVPGILDFVQGQFNSVFLKTKQLGIKPQICYESIFPQESRIRNDDVDFILNITNDTYYGNSSGPYQHFQIAKMRAIENSLPMVRATNNGISAVVDPIGRVIYSTKMNAVTVIDGLLPKKLNYISLYSIYGNRTLLAWIIIALLLQQLVKYLEIILITFIKGALWPSSKWACDKVTV